MSESHLFTYLKSMNATSYYIYPFPTGRLYLFGDESYLKLVLFGYRVKDLNEIEEHFDPKITSTMHTAIKFLDNYIIGENSELPNLDIGSFTDKEATLYYELLKISFGDTISYNNLANRAGIKNGARFAGNAMAKNSLPIFIPCHRVIRSDGRIGNYSAGKAVKQFLLQHERVICDKKNREENS